VMANGPAEEMARARAILEAHKPARLDLHAGAAPTSEVSAAAAAL
jgi:hypothetical protein